MHPKVKEWLETESFIKNKSHFQVICEFALAKDNGTIQPQDQFQLMRLSSFMMGVVWACGNLDEFEVSELIRNRVEHLKSGRKVFVPTDSEIRALGVK